MTEQQPPKLPRNGRDFAIGYLSGLLPLALTLWMMNVSNSDIQIYGFYLFLGGGALLFIAMIVMFCKSRKFIGFGLLALFITAPLLVYGACTNTSFQM